MAKKKSSARAAEKNTDKTKLVSPISSVSDYEHTVFLNVQEAYEEAKIKREKYKKIGPTFVAVSGVVFLTLIFALDAKITFLLFWVITILYTVALMVRAEYKYHQFQGYLGLLKEENFDERTDAEASQLHSDKTEVYESVEKEQEAKA